MLAKAFNCDDNGKFKSLWNDDNCNKPSASEADMALCTKLAFWTRDADQIERLVRQSNRVRDKWGERRGKTTWIQETIRAALDYQTECYNWDRAHAFHLTDTGNASNDSLGSLATDR